jgi:hypothetical protein
VEALLAGVPVVAYSDASVAYRVSEHTAASIDTIPLRPRLRWLEGIAFSQWSASEAKAALPWVLLRHQVHSGLRLAGGDVCCPVIGRTSHALSCDWCDKSRIAL